MVVDIPHSEIVATVDQEKQDQIQLEQDGTVTILLPPEEPKAEPAKDSGEETSYQILEPNLFAENNLSAEGSDSVAIVTQANFTQEVLESNQPVVVDVYAVWCGQCCASAPIFAELGGRFGGQIKFAKLNFDEERAVANEFDVTVIPTFLFFKGGKVVDRYIGSLENNDEFLAKLQAFVQ
jgi:thioredoxin 1